VAKRRSKQKGGKVTRGQGWEVLPAHRGGGAPRKHTASKAPADQKIVVREERRKDKQVTVARGFELLEADLKKLAKTCKSKLASGGAAKDDAIEIQGRHREKLSALLRDAGYQVR
jgi:translation initiation factor 1